MIFDNSGIDYSRMLLFVFGFLFTGKLNQILAPSATWLQSGHIKVLKKNKMWRQRQQFKVLLQ